MHAPAVNLPPAPGVYVPVPPPISAPAPPAQPALSKLQQMAPVLLIVAVVEFVLLVMALVTGIFVMKH